MKALRHLAAVGDWRARAVLRRNLRVFMRNWRTALLPPAFEPIVFFLAFGIGLDRHVGGISYGSQTLDYATYVAPGLLAYSAWGTPFYEGLYSAYVRMFYQKTWDGILATQVELHHLLWGEILWAGARGFVNLCIVACVLAGFHALGFVQLQLQWLPLLPFIGAVAGWVFAAFGLIFTAIVPSIDHMNYPVFLIGIPLSLVSNTYFPVRPETAWLRWLMELNPVYQLAETFRGALVTGSFDQHAWRLLVLCGIYLAGLFLLAEHLLKKRVLGS